MDVDGIREQAEQEHDEICAQGRYCYSREKHIHHSYIPRITKERLNEANQKLRKISDLMHPGHWGTGDYRRNAILKVLESNRDVWNGDPYSA